MNSYKLSIAYDGTNYYGFQKQKNKPTIQGKLEEALNVLLDSYELNYSGRTDAGVHAKSQIVNIKTAFVLDSKKINSLNKILGDSISINSFKVVSDNFHARYGATERTYKYLVRDSKSNYPHLNKNTYQYHSLLNLDDLNKVAKLFEQGLISSKDLSSELLNILRSKRDEIVFKMKLTSKDEFDVLSKRVENLENKIKKFELKKRQSKKVKKS